MNTAETRDNLSNYRFPKRHLEQLDTNRKKLKMNTSTPVSFGSYRCSKTDTDISPISADGKDNSETSVEVVGRTGCMEKTNISDAAGKMYVRTPEILSKSEEDRHFGRLTENWTRAAVDARVITRSSSLPGRLDQVKLRENSMFFKFPTWRDSKEEIGEGSSSIIRRSISADMTNHPLDLSPWDDKQAFEKFKREMEETSAMVEGKLRLCVNVQDNIGHIEVDGKTAATDTKVNV